MCTNACNLQEWNKAESHVFMPRSWAVPIALRAGEGLGLLGGGLGRTPPHAAASPEGPGSAPGWCFPAVPSAPSRG